MGSESDKKRGGSSSKLILAFFSKDLINTISCSG